MHRQFIKVFNLTSLLTIPNDLFFFNPKHYCRDSTFFTLNLYYYFNIIYSFLPIDAVIGTYIIIIVLVMYVNICFKLIV